ncbi:MAG: glycosyltransferase, partial [Lachnospiraceae bacterium]|nr:glycosyltransferase [Lachnospiraceae bacterium]
MSRIFIVGDHKTGTGPANVTKEYIRLFPKGTLYQKRTSKIGRLPELYFNILRSDIILFSGYSAQNVLGMKFAKKLKKPTAYIVHGAIDHENKINNYENANMSSVEAKTLELADRLFAVSNKFMGWLKAEYPQYENKIDYVTNGIDERTVARECSGDNRKILSIGGGMPRKMILHICVAIEKINAKTDKPLTLYVIGKDGNDTE